MEDGACCDRVSLRFGAGGWGAELKRIQVIAMKQLNFSPCAVAWAHGNVLPAGSVAGSHFFVSMCLRASVFFPLCPVNVTCLG